MVPCRVIGVSGPVNHAGTKLVQDRKQVGNIVVSIVCVHAMRTRKLRPPAQGVMTKAKIVIVEIQNVCQAVESVILVSIRRTCRGRK